jgi:hypothetical protein
VLLFSIYLQHIKKHKDSLDIAQFVGHTIDIDVEVKDGTFQFVTKALDQTFRHSGLNYICMKTLWR